MSVVETDVAAVHVSDAGAASRVNNYRILQLLGEGAFSKVYECEDGDGRHFALKVLNKSFLKRKREYKRVDGKLVLSNAFQKVQKEVAIMKKLSHSHLVKLHEVIDSPADNKMFLVLDLIRGGQVMDWDKKSFSYRTTLTPSGVLGRTAVRACLRDVVVALDYLHRNRICHRDIKPENILLSSAEEGYKLADFGVAHMLEPEGEGAAADRDQSMLRSTEGTYHFLAPECTTGELYDPFQVDIWALGVTMFAMLKGTLPFGTNAASLDAVMASIREDALVLPDDLAPECTELLACMLAKSPSERITIPQLLTHSWLWDSSATPPTPHDGNGEEAHGEESVVEVTAMEIEAAFTPVNNFILMTKIKMKMGSRLARMRKSIDSRQELVGNGGALARRQSQPLGAAIHPLAPHHNSSNSDLAVPPLSDTCSKLSGVTEDDTKADNTVKSGKLCEVSTCEASPGKPGLQKRKSNIVEVLSESMSALAAMKPTTLLRRNSAIASSPGKLKLGDHIETTMLDALPTRRLENSHTATNAEEESVKAQPDAPTRAVAALNIHTTEIGGLVTSEPAGSHGRLDQPQLARQRLTGRSSTITHMSGASSTTFSDISTSGRLMRRSSGLPSMSATRSARSRSASPSKAVRLGKLDATADRLGCQPFADVSPALQQQRCDPLDAREEVSHAPSLFSSGKSREEDSLEVGGNVDTVSNHSKKTLAVLTTAQEVINTVDNSPTKPPAGGGTIDADGENSRGSRPQSPRSKRSSSALGSHSQPQAKLPPIDLNSQPNTPTTRSPLASPVAADSPQHSRRSTVDFSLRASDVEALSTVDEGLPLRLSPSRRHTLLDRSSCLDDHALPAFSAPHPVLSTPSSAQTDSITCPSDGELTAESSHSDKGDEGDNVSAPTPPLEDEAAGSSAVQANADMPEALSLLSRDAQRSLKLSISLSTPHLPRYHSPVRPDGGIHHLSTASASPSVGLSSSSSTGSLSPRHKLPSPSRVQPAPMIQGTVGDEPDLSAGPMALMVRMSSLAKALDDCLSPEDNAKFYSFRTTPRMGLPAIPVSDEAAQAVQSPSVAPAVDEKPRAARRRSSACRSLLEAQDSLKLVTNAKSPPVPSSTAFNALQRLGEWRAGRGPSSPPRTAVCVLM